MPIYKFSKNEKGSVAVLLALSMVALAGFTALALDFGQVYYERHRLSNIVDSAALAGAQEMPKDPLEAKIKAEEYVERNGGDMGEIHITIDNDNDSIIVEGMRDVTYKFARVLGFDETTVAASAVAKAGRVGTTSGIMPFGVQDQDLTFGKLYDMKVHAPPTQGAGNFGALALGGPGANTYRDNIKYDYDDLVGITDVLETETGNMDGPTSDGVNYRVYQESCSNTCTPDSYNRDCSRLVTVPIYIPLGDKNNIKQVEIVGFAAFLLEGVTNDGSVKGYFVKDIVPGEIDESAGDYGLKAVKLIK